MFLPISAAAEYRRSLSNMTTFREMLAEVKSSITEVAPLEASNQMAEGAHLLDVREPDELIDGAVEGSIRIPRGMLELSIEAKIPQRSDRIVVMCAGGTRSALAVKSLHDLGYDSAVSMACLLYTSDAADE